MRDPLIGEVIGGEFEIKEKLGEGGMGAVYLATQKQTERSVAVKVLLRSLYDENLFGRFRQEAQIVSKLSHPGIITIYTYGQHADRTLFIAMELVKGRSLGELLDDAEPFDVDRALPLMIQMADALAYAHDQKIIHRDIKPGNVMITRTGRNESVKVLDFGIAKMLDGNAALTRTGTLCGSPVFMSPEQWHQLRDIDGRTDIYSLGCVFYQMMAGRPPHEADTTIGYMMAHTQHRPLAVEDVSNTISQHPPLGDIIMRCLEIERADRYPDMYALLDALKECEATFLASRRNGPGTSPPPAAERKAAKKPPKHLAETVANAKASDAPAEKSLSLAMPDPVVSATGEPSPPEPSRPESTMTAERTITEGTSTFRLQAGAEATPKQDTAHYILAAVGAVMIALLAIAVFATQ
ncbi:MAG: serine/threonine protein kinase [Deltaproteobacteria bacterium]|nr:serine/threonine protein kinase [Deltaproteobacteria bacterium]